MVVVMASATMGVIVWFGPWQNPHSFTRGQAIGPLLRALVATGSTEWVREVLRKPYAVRGVLYSSGLRPEQVEGLRENGYLQSAAFARDFAASRGDTELARGE